MEVILKIRILVVGKLGLVMSVSKDYFPALRMDLKYIDWVFK